ncbi:hypothetical protein DZE40_001130 [Clostridium beijerinckii]|uniref:Uncharacterized protein n=1 Tax=Clostridium beijerinckii TaxID=1520 RepID=A0A1S8S8H5_CLOBE|nr:hypothetical protein [Clostridium beijerinckii]OOM61788.1 hypothetical protein CLBCK_21540 [Clostridium beijerinckii]
MFILIFDILIKKVSFLTSFFYGILKVRLDKEVYKINDNKNMN